MSDYDLYVKHDHYHHVVDPDQSSYTSNGDDSSSYDDSSSSTDSSSDYPSDTTSNDACTDANHNGQCDITEMSPPDCEPCQEVSQDTDNGIADVGDSGDSGGGGGDSGGGSSDSGGSGDGSSSN